MVWDVLTGFDGQFLYTMLVILFGLVIGPWALRGVVEWIRTNVFGA